MSRNSRIAVAACFTEIHPGSREMQLLPAGRFFGRDGRPTDAPGWFINKDVAERVIKRAAARATRFVTDYEHQTLNVEKNGQPAPAAGWFTGAKLEWRDGEGLFATDMEWTGKAVGHIAAREYLYVSPVFSYDKKTGEVLELLMAAITNNPAVDGMQDLTARAAARYSTQEKDDMKALLISLLGLAETATEDECVAALKALQKKATDSDAAVAAAKAQVPDPAKFVPVETMRSLQEEVAALTARVAATEVDEVIAQAFAAKKLVPAQEAWARDLGKTNIAALKSYIATAPEIAVLGGTQTGGKGAGGDSGSLDETAIAICRQLGVSEEDFKKTAAAA